MSDSGDDETFKLYRYNPSIAVAGVAAGLFAITTLIHCWQMWRSRAWFLVPLVIGGFFEIVGFAGRAYSASETPDWTLGPYIIQSVLPLVAPALFARSIYMILGRIILMSDGESYSLIRGKWLTKLFVTCDVLAFAIQAGGAGFMSAGNLQSMKNGEHIVIGGLLVQIIAFGIFVVVAVVFHIRMRKVPPFRVTSEYIPWQRHLYVLYASSALIMIRSIFRVAEFATGNDGFLFRHEVFMWVLDAMLMLLALIIFNWIHPGEIGGYVERAKKSDVESRDGMVVSVEFEEYSSPARKR